MRANKVLFATRRCYGILLADCSWGASLSQTERHSYPEWTEYRKKNGLDPLGMQSGSVNLYQRLLPGISNVTLRMRYYGLYAWLAHRYAKDSGATSLKSWQQYIRRAEALYALIAQRKGGETGVAGIDWANRTAAEANGKAIDFKDAADPDSAQRYLKQSWGAYGAAYASQLYEIGIFAEAKEHNIPVPSAQIGDRLAKSFADSLGGIASAFIKAIHDGSVSQAALDKFADIAPSNIPQSGDERDCYEDILFARTGVKRPGDLDRRKSLMLLLALTNQYSAVPAISDVRWMLYAGYDSDDQALGISADDLIAQRWRWWVYEANDLLHVCYAALLKYTLDVLGEYPAGISLPRLIGETTTRMTSAADEKPADWESFLAAHPAPQNGFAPDDETSEFYLEEELMDGMRPNGVSQAADAWIALKLLAVLHNRVRTSPKSPADELGTLNRGVVHSLVTEMRFIEAHRKEAFADFLARLIEERVVRRHLWVGLRKFRHQGDYTFLIETDDGRVRQRAVDGPVFTNPRLGPALTFLEDIYLIGDKGLTARGKKLMSAS